MKGYITARQEFLFPDSPLGEMADKVHLAMAANGRMGIQLLVAAGESIRVSAPEDRVQLTCCQMVDIPVEYNTGNGVDQGGAMVILPDKCPDYAVRKAPFRVYDCLKPAPGGVIPAVNGVAAAYVTLEPREGTAPGSTAGATGRTPLNRQSRKNRKRPDPLTGGPDVFGYPGGCAGRECRGPKWKRFHRRIRKNPGKNSQKLYHVGFLS